MIATTKVAIIGICAIMPIMIALAARTEDPKQPDPAPPQVSSVGKTDRLPMFDDRFVSLPPTVDKAAQAMPTMAVEVSQQPEPHVTRAARKPHRDICRGKGKRWFNHHRSWRCRR